MHVKQQSELAQSPAAWGVLTACLPALGSERGLGAAIRASFHGVWRSFSYYVSEPSGADVELRMEVYLSVLKGT